MADSQASILVVPSVATLQGVSLHDRVRLRRPVRIGTVEWLGVIDDEERFGIRLDNLWNGRGRNNGSIGSKYYFDAAENTGVFVKRDRICSVLGEDEMKVIDENEISNLKSILGSETEKISLQSHFLGFLMEQLQIDQGFRDQMQGIAKKVSHYSKRVCYDTASESCGQSCSISEGSLDDTLRGASLHSMFTHCKSGGGALRVQKVLPTGSSRCLSREFENFDDENQDCLELPEQVELEQKISIIVHAPSELSEVFMTRRNNLLRRSSSRSLFSASAERVFISPEVSESWDVPTRQTARTIWEDPSLVEIMGEFEDSTENWSDKANSELAEDPVLWCLSADARQRLDKPQKVVEMLHDLQRCINLIDRFIPEMTSEMQKNSKDTQEVYMTNVIQELLKRAKQNHLSTRILNDFSGVNYSLETQELYSGRDIEKMVELMAWIRNNITASCVTDENDAKMASLGAREVQQSLKGVLRLQMTEGRPRRSGICGVFE